MNFVNLLYFIAAVLVIVDGQSTTDDDTDKDEISKLTYTVAELRAELTKSAKRISKLEGMYCKVYVWLITFSRAELVQSANAIADLKSQLKN